MRAVAVGPRERARPPAREGGEVGGGARTRSGRSEGTQPSGRSARGSLGSRETARHGRREPRQGRGRTRGSVQRGGQRWPTREALRAIDHGAPWRSATSSTRGPQKVGQASEGRASVRREPPRRRGARPGWCRRPRCHLRAATRGAGAGGSADGLDPVGTPRVRERGRRNSESPGNRRPTTRPRSTTRARNGVTRSARRSPGSGRPASEARTRSREAPGERGARRRASRARRPAASGDARAKPGRDGQTSDLTVPTLTRRRRSDPDGAATRRRPARVDGRGARGLVPRRPRRGCRSRARRDVTVRPGGRSGRGVPVQGSPGEHRAHPVGNGRRRNGRTQGSRP